MPLISSRTFTNDALTLPYMINVDNPSLEYSRYMMDAPKKTDTKNQPTKLEFSLLPFDEAFTKLRRGNYIVMQTSTYPNWFTGFIINDPQLTIVGVFNKQAVYGYKYVAMSDEYLINLKPLGVIKPFLNMTQGAILSALADNLCAGMYDFTNVQDGILLPRYQVDPTVKFVDIVKEFCDAACYTFYGKAGKLYFLPSDTTQFSLTIDGNDPNFTPANLTLTPTSDPIINDATVLGQIEPQGYVNEYFAGDGFTGAFSLIESPFGVDSTILITDTFSSSSLDSTKWTLYDAASNFIQLSGGYVNVLGGLGLGTFDVHIDSAFPVPVEGQLRMTQGEWDFLPDGTNVVSGVIGGLWTQEPNPAYTGCVYGIVIDKSSGTLKAYPVINGVPDLTQVITLDTANRYVIRTNYDCAITYRTSTSTSYVDVTGAIVTVETPNPTIYSPLIGSSSSALPTTGIAFQTLFSLVNVISGDLTNQTIFTNFVADITDVPSYALYIPVASNDLHATFTNVTVSVPIQGTLQIAPPANVGQISTMSSPRVLDFATATLGQNELDSLDGEAPDATITDTNNGVQTQSSLLGTPQYNSGAASLTFFKNSVALQSTTPAQGSLIWLEYRAAGAAIGRSADTDSVNAEAAVWKDDGIRAVVQTNVSPLPRTSDECELVAAALIGGNSYQHYEGNYSFNSDYLTNDYEPISGSIIKFQNLPASFPDIQAEEVTQVVTTLDSRRPHERFTHTANFGNLDRVAQLLATYYQPSDVFMPLDTSITPISVPLGLVGTTFCNMVTTLQFVGMDDWNYYFTINEQPPITGGFEVRYTDDSWGCDDTNNIVARIFYNPYQTSYLIGVPRDSRSKVIFVRPFDGRNLLPYSEDFTQWTTSNCTVGNSTIPDPEGNYSTISKVTGGSGEDYYVQQILSAYIASSHAYGAYGAAGGYGEGTLAYPGSVYEPTSYGWSTYGAVPYGEELYTAVIQPGIYTFTVDLNITAGAKVRMQILDLNGTYSTFQDFVGVGAWQRESITSTIPSNGGYVKVAIRLVANQSSGSGYAASFYATNASVEAGTTTETQYCKTHGFPYGVNSRFSTAARVNFPLIPPPIKEVSVAFTGNLDDLNTVITGSGITELTSYIQQINASGTPTQTDPTPATPQITLTLPDEELDVFGVEIRDHDNATVLYRQNLTTAAFSLAVSLTNPEGLADLKYFVYTYNVFGEYSESAQVSTSIYVPGLATLNISYSQNILIWTLVQGAPDIQTYSFLIEIDQTDGTFTHIIDSFSVMGINYAVLPTGAFLPSWFRVTPSTSYGTATPTVINSTFTQLGVDGFDASSAYITVVI